MTRETVALTGEKETLLITFYAKAMESHLPDSLLRDRFAAAAVERIDYDFAKLKVRRDDMIGLAIRAHLFDELAKDFIARHADAMVLNLGTGLDTRVFRVDPPPSVLWFDVDYPEVIALRCRLYPERPGYTLLGSSVTEPGWLQSVPTDRPAIVLAEGLLMYLQAKEGIGLLSRLAGHLPRGEIAFDIFTRLGNRMVQKNHSIRTTGAQLQWSIEEPCEIEAQAPELALVQSIIPYEGGPQIARLSWLARITIKLFLAIPRLRKMARILRYRFG